MAVRFDAAADRYSSAITTGGTITVVFWGKVTVDRNALSSMFEVLSGGTWTIMQTIADGTTFGCEDASHQGASQLGAVALTVGTWYAMGFTVSGANAALFTGTDPASLTKITNAAWNTLATGTMYIGNNDTASAFLNGSITGLKVWSAVLSDAEIAAELAQIAPVRTANLLRYHPLLTTDALDYSGNAAVLTTAGTLAVEATAPTAPTVTFGTSLWPVVAARSSGTTASATTHSIATMPTGVQAGDLLVVVFSCNTAPTIFALNSHNPDGGTQWSKLGQTSQSTTTTGAIFYRTAGSSSDLCQLKTATAAASSYEVLAIRGADPQLYGASFAASATNTDPPALTPSPGSKNYLWIATRSGAGTVVATVAPASYTNLQTQAGVSGSASTNTAERVLAGTTDNPGTFTSATASNVAWTLAAAPRTTAPAGCPQVIAAASRAMIDASVNGAQTITINATAGDTLLILHWNDFYTLAGMITPTASAGIGALSNIGSHDGGTNNPHGKAYLAAVNTTADHTITFRATTDEEAICTVLVLRGTGIASDAAMSGAAWDQTGPPYDQIAPSVSPTAATSLLISQAVIRHNTTANNVTTPPTGMVKWSEATMDPFFQIATGVEYRSSSGATGTRTWTSSQTALSGATAINLALSIPSITAVRPRPVGVGVAPRMRSANW